MRPGRHNHFHSLRDGHNSHGFHSFHIIASSSQLPQPPCLIIVPEAAVELGELEVVETVVEE